MQSGKSAKNNVYFLWEGKNSKEKFCTPQQHEKDDKLKCSAKSGEHSFSSDEPLLQSSLKSESPFSPGIIRQGNLLRGESWESLRDGMRGTSSLPLIQMKTLTLSLVVLFHFPLELKVYLVLYVHEQVS